MHHFKNIFKNICLIILLSFTLFGCSEKIEKNHNRYDFTSNEVVNSFLKDNLIVKKHESISEPYAYLITIYNNSDYYINNIPIQCFYDKEQSHGWNLPQTIAIRPYSEVQLILPVQNSKAIDWEHVYFMLQDDCSKPANVCVTLEENPSIIYSTDLNVSAKYTSLYTMDITLKNKTNNPITLNGKYLFFYDQKGEYQSLERDNSVSFKDYNINIPSNGKVNEEIMIPATITIDENTKVIFSGGEELENEKNS